MNTEELLSHSGWVRALARSLILDTHQVDDVVQNAMLAALEGPPRKETNLRAWFAVVTRNIVRQDARTERRRSVRERRSARDEGLPSTEELVGKAELQKKLVQAVMALDEPYRTTLLLRYIEELSAEEIARRLGVSGSTIRNRIKRALEKLREALDRETDGDRRSWCLGLVPLAVCGGGARAATKAASTATVQGGGLAMILQPTLAALGIVVLSLGTLFVAAPEWGSSPPEEFVVGAVVVEDPAVAETPTVPDDPGDGAAVTPAGLFFEPAEPEPEPSAFEEGDPPLHLAGRVVDEAGTPVAGARVFVGARRSPFDGDLREARTGRGEGQGAVGKIFETDPKGRFRVTVPEREEGETPDRLYVHVFRSPGIHPRTDFGEWVDLPEDDLQLVARRVPTAKLKITLVDRSTGSEIPRFRYSISEAGKEEPLHDGQIGRKTRDVVLELPRRDPARYTVRLEESSLPRATASVLLGPGDEKAVELIVQSEEGMRGLVLDPEGRPLSGALVYWGGKSRMVGRSPFDPYDPERIHDGVRTGADGGYSLRGSGREITVWHERYSPVSVSRSEADEVRVLARGEIAGRLVPPLQQSEEGEGEPYHVKLDKQREVRADRDGGFRFGDVIAGVRSLYGPRHVTVDVEPGQVLEVTIGPFLDEVEVEWIANGRPFLKRYGGVVLGTGRVGTVNEVINREGRGTLWRPLPGPYVFMNRQGLLASFEIDGPTTTIDLGDADLSVLGSAGTPFFIVPEGSSELVERAASAWARQEIREDGIVRLTPFRRGRYVITIPGRGLVTKIEVEGPGASVHLRDF